MMRILALQDKEENEYTIFAVSEVLYDYDVYGIAFITFDGDYYCIPEVSIKVFNHICKELLVQGYYDAVSLGEIQTLPD